VLKQGIYPLELSTNSLKYSRDCVKPDYHYEAIQVNVVEDGYYTFGSDSAEGFYCYLYEGKFSPFKPSMNILKIEKPSDVTRGIILTDYLRKETTYILVVTTHEPNEIGSFSLIAIGPNSILLKRNGEYVQVFQNLT
jgi:hypothetical protein